jgi:hypothetical protein
MADDGCVGDLIVCLSRFQGCLRYVNGGFDGILEILWKKEKKSFRKCLLQPLAHTFLHDLLQTGFWEYEMKVDL